VQQPKKKRKQKQKLELKQQPKILVYLFLENKRNGDCKHTGMAKKGNKMPGNGNEIAIAGPHRRRQVAKR